MRRVHTIALVFWSALCCLAAVIIGVAITGAVLNVINLVIKLLRRQP